jgi:uncharacterized membrane protein
MWGMLFLSGALVALAVWGVSLLFPRATSRAAPHQRELTALQILLRRYVRGELSRDQYDLMRGDIGHDRDAPGDGEGR